MANNFRGGLNSEKYVKVWTNVVKIMFVPTFTSDWVSTQDAISVSLNMKMYLQDTKV